MTIQHAGSDWGTVKVMDVASKKFHEKDVLEWTKHTGMSWTNDNKGFFYQRYNAPKSDKGDKNHRGEETDKLENMKIYYHYIGTE